MNYGMSCHRCGSKQIASSNDEDDCAEISCHECGEFLDTVGHWNDIHSPSLAFQALNQSKILASQMNHATAVPDAALAS